MFDALTGEFGGYSKEVSQILYSPSLSQLADALSHISQASKDIDVLTFFFAGHGVGGLGSYYLCVEDTREGALSLTGLSLVQLLAFISEFGPRQAHVILDACEAGGAMLDLAAILRKEVVGNRESVSMSFLAAAAADEYAYETDQGGVLTGCLLDVMEGRRKVQDARGYLDLVEVGRAISADLGDSDQGIVAWGLNLYGEGRFSLNPFFVGEMPSAYPSIQGIAPFSALGQRISKHSEALWREYTLITDERSARDLYSTLDHVATEIQDAPELLWEFLRGVSTALRARASSSKDLFAEFNALAACMVCALPRWQELGAEQFVRDMGRELFEISGRLRRLVRAGVQSEPSFLMSFDGWFNNLFFLPIRISKLLGWLGLTALVGRELQVVDEAEEEDIRLTMQVVVDAYRKSISAVSEEQAGSIYLFIAGALSCGALGPAGDALSRITDSFVDVDGRIARRNLPPEGMVRYLLSRARDASSIGPEDYARPSDLLSIILLTWSMLGSEDVVDEFLVVLDKQVAGLFVPESYADFAKEIIEEGSNHLLIVGEHFWRVSEFVSIVNTELLAGLESRSELRSTHVRILAMLSSLLFPDRLPLFIGYLSPS